MRTAHVRTGRCPGCGKYRRLDHVRLVGTRLDDPRRAPKNKPKCDVKVQRVCVDCGSQSSEAA